jgi:hypothetical protein
MTIGRLTTLFTLLAGAATLAAASTSAAPQARPGLH